MHGDSSNGGGSTSDLATVRRLVNRLHFAEDEIERLRGAFRGILHVLEFQATSRHDIVFSIAENALKQSQYAYPRLGDDSEENDP